MNSHFTILETMVTDMLTHKDMIKCIHSEGGNLFFTDATSLLHELDLKDALVEYIVSAAHEYGTQHGTHSADTGLYFVCMFVRVSKQLKEQGIPVDVIIDEILHIFHDVQSSRQMKTVSIQDAVSMLHELKTKSCSVIGNKHWKCDGEDILEMAAADIQCGDYGLTKNGDILISNSFSVDEDSKEGLCDVVEIVTSPTTNLALEEESDGAVENYNEEYHSSKDIKGETDDFSDGNEDDFIKELEQLQTDITKDLEQVKLFQTLSQSRQPYYIELRTHDDDSDFEDCFDQMNNDLGVSEISMVCPFSTEVKFAETELEQSDELIEVNFTLTRNPGGKNPANLITKQKELSKDDKAFNATSECSSVKEMDLAQVNKLLKSVSDKQTKFSLKLAILSRHINADEVVVSGGHDDNIDDQKNIAKHDRSKVTEDMYNSYEPTAVIKDFTDGVCGIKCGNSKYKNSVSAHNVRIGSDKCQAMSGLLCEDTGSLSAEMENVIVDGHFDRKTKPSVNDTFQQKGTVAGFMEMTTTNNMLEKTREKSHESDYSDVSSGIGFLSEADDKISRGDEFENYSNTQSKSRFKKKLDHRKGDVKQECSRSQNLGQEEINNKHDGVTKMLTDRESILLVVNAVLGTDGEDFIDVVAATIEGQNVRESCESNTALRFNMGQIQIHSVNGVSRKPVLVNGLVIQSSLEVLDTVSRYPKKNYRALLVNSDVTMSYRHKGYNPLKLKQTMTPKQYMEGGTEAERWLDSVLLLLKKLNITLLLVKGGVSPVVQHACDTAGVIIISKVPYRLLEQISTSTKVDLLTYVPLATQTHVCGNLQISAWASDSSDRQRMNGQSQQEVVLSIPGKPRLQTVVVSGVSPVVCSLRNQEVLTCLHQVASVLNSSDLLLGQYQFEKLCIETCERKTDEGQTLLREGDEAVTANMLIAQALKDCFLRYIHLQVGRQSRLESLSSKLEMFRWALSVARIALKTDSFVMTGLKDMGTSTSCVYDIK